ncbi:hypothetical protein BKA65DRAFT_518439 [Rhexocercosporidium sp. MPI-PUGE-AT-0058]|nr:hypothetical protein BKA65DRAFT_518439 [Rhexocercosporidium sp. MPI-PUGE-AT-0058]
MDQEPTSGPGRSRGRPRKGTKDDPQEEKRAKGRQAQRTYMQRKQAETDKLRKRIISLEDAIEGMSEEFLSFGERVVNTSQVPERTQALSDLKGTTERFLSIARVAEAVAVDEAEDGASEDKLGAGSPSLSAGGAGALQQAIVRPASPKLQSYISSSKDIETPFQLNTMLSPFTSATIPHMGIQPQIQPTHGRFSPRLTHGLLSTSSLQNSALSSLWTHYLIAGPNSFALRLYKDTLHLMFRVLRGELSNPGFIPSIGRFRFKYESIATFISLAQGQLSRMSIGDGEVEMGGNPNQTPAAAADVQSSLVLFGPRHPVMVAPLRKMIHGEVNEEIGSMNEWLDPWNTQQYLMRRWGLRCSYETANISAERWAAVTSDYSAVGDFSGIPAMLPGSGTGTGIQDSYPWDAPNRESGVDVSDFFGDAGLPGLASRTPDFVFNSQPLAEKLIQEAVCFGEGPRFFKEHIDDAVKQFLGRVP